MTMNRDEMLKALRVTNEELQDFIHKYKAFLATLDQPQRSLIERSLPTLQEAVAAFGPDVMAEDLLRLFGGDEHHKAVIFCAPFGDGKRH